MLYLLNTEYTFTGNFGRTRTGDTITVAVLDNAGNVSSDATIGAVAELSDGFYGVTITFTAQFSGYIKWTDTDVSVDIYNTFTVINGS